MIGLWETKKVHTGDLSLPWQTYFNFSSIDMRIPKRDEHAMKANGMGYRASYATLKALGFANCFNLCLAFTESSFPGSRSRKY